MSVFSQAQASALTLPTAFQQHESSPSPPPKKLLNVTFTILSMTGVHAKESCKKKKSSVRSKLTFGKFWQGESNVENESFAGDESTVGGIPGQQPTTTVVASFERTEQKQPQEYEKEYKSSNQDDDGNDTKTIVTHIPSLPLNLPPPITSSSRNSKASAKMFNDVVSWPEQNDGTHSKISSFTFSRYFPHEEHYNVNRNKNDNENEKSASRFVPQMCPIQISISRNGKMYKLGHAHVFVSGEENGESSMNVPVVNFEQAFNSRTISKNGSSECNLMRLKDDTLKCGLGDCATLRLLVTVSDPMVPRIQVNYVLSPREIREQLKRDEEESMLRGNKGMLVHRAGTENNVTGGTRCEQLAAQEGTTANNKLLSPTAENLLALSLMTIDTTLADQALSAASTVPMKKGHRSASKSLHHRESSNASRSTRYSSYRERSEFSKGTNYTDFTEGSFADEEDCTQRDDDCSTDSESSSEEELLKLIRGITKKGQGSSSRTNKKDNSNSTVCSSLATNSTDNSTRVSESDSIDSPPMVNRMSNAFTNDCGRITGTSGGRSSTSSTASSLMSSWTRRLVCCAGTVGGMNIVGGGSTSAKDDESLLLASINEEDNSIMTFDEKGTYYSLEGRKHSLETLETDQFPW